MSKRPYKSNFKTDEDITLNKKIGEKIKEARLNRIIYVSVPETKDTTHHIIKRQKLCTQSELAKYMNVSFQQIQKYEKGYNGLSTIRLLKISKFFGKPLEYFTSEATELLGQDNLPSNNSLINAPSIGKELN